METLRVTVKVRVKVINPCTNVTIHSYKYNKRVKQNCALALLLILAQIKFELLLFF